MSTSIPVEPWHRHDRRCYWDHTRCGWVCPPAEVELPGVEFGAAEISPAGFSAVGFSAVDLVAEDSKRPPARAAVI